MHTLLASSVHSKSIRNKALEKWYIYALLLKENEYDTIFYSVDQRNVCQRAPGTSIFFFWFFFSCLHNYWPSGAHKKANALSGYRIFQIWSNKYLLESQKVEHQKGKGFSEPYAPIWDSIFCWILLSKHYTENILNLKSKAELEIERMIVLESIYKYP